jgi:hypothetical protein
MAEPTEITSAEVEWSYDQLRGSGPSLTVLARGAAIQRYSVMTAQY